MDSTPDPIRSSPMYTEHIHTSFRAVSQLRTRDLRFMTRHFDTEGGRGGWVCTLGVSMVPLSIE